ncbi:MAG: hypothetical protein KC425_27730, partial [Anaerolineales bacterium]|nr:hypothetical protein [Anaerolineales bacterium]
MTNPYPPAHRTDTVDDYHGTPVADPYRWLEDPFSPETQAWIAAQNALTRRILDAVPQRPAIHARLTQLWDYPKWFAPVKKGAWFFYEHNDGLQNQAVLYRTADLAQTPEVALDPNTLSSDGTAALTSRAITDDGSHLAYGISFGGSDRQEIRIRDLDNGREYPEILQHCRFAGIAWTYDAAGAPTGFYYNRYPAPDPTRPDAPPLNNHVCWHRLHTPQAADLQVYARPDAPQLGFAPGISEDGRFLVLHAWQTTSKNRLYYQRIDSEGRLLAADFVRLIDEPDANFYFLGSIDDTFYVHTDWQAPNGRVVAIDLARPDRAHWQDVLPESAAIIDSCTLAADKLAVVTLQNATHHLHLHPLTP